MSQWSDFYKERMNDRYRNHVANKYGFLIDMIAGLGKNASCVAEMGAGAGNVSHHVAKVLPNVKHVLTDRDPAMLELAASNVRGAPVELHHHDLLSDDYSLVKEYRPKIIHGHGVLEHFSDEEIQHIIAKQLECSEFVLHYVPTNKYETPSFGDERLMSPLDWDRIARPFYRATFNGGHDLLLGWKKS